MQIPKSYTHNFNAEHLAQLYIEVLSLLQVKHLSRQAGITAYDLAQRIGCDHRAISAAVSTQTGSNFLQLLGRIRTQEAAKLLHHPKYAQYTVEEIGLLCGFSSRQSFYNAFHRNFNTTPRQYRLTPAAHAVGLSAVADGSSTCS